MRESFRFFSSFLDTAKAIEDAELQRKYLLAVAEYGIEGKEPDDAMIKALMVQTMFTLDKSNQISLSASERGKMGGTPKKEFTIQEKAKKLNKANESKSKLTKTNESEVEVEYIDNNKLLSSNTNVLDTKDNITSNINNLIQELKDLANSLGIAYDKKDERNFGKHILTAKEFGAFAGKLSQTPLEFAKNIMVASVKINYWKGPCNGPRSIYQNYAEVYNQTVAKSRKAVNNDGVF